MRLHLVKLFPQVITDVNVSVLYLVFVSMSMLHRKIDREESSIIVIPMPNPIALTCFKHPTYSCHE